MVIIVISFQLWVTSQAIAPKTKIPKILHTIDLIQALERVSKVILFSFLDFSAKNFSFFLYTLFDSKQQTDIIAVIEGLCQSLL
jgi:hypothetical protein